ncbi:ABC transporter ATP-binding protein [Tropicimonas sp. IMCC6043]|uniref:ABC transporter ATP-binding protein n=1 Tax=Tropicimonas sp. IMCC6043 TaxID=2510645 RepID=UPI00101D607A|nr:ABC transporter ATP-binding protein [Tropicimonas sp. IMCC6043]RYH12388.1 ABC transporter ATP-binding protein [Tropicimonas sp. IMCC6043]
MSGVALTADGLRKSFRGGRVVGLDRVDLAAPEGALIAITGASGSGKSTLLHALAGLIALDGGSVEVLGQRPRRRADWTRLRRDAIGMIFQEDWLIPGLSALENVELPLLGTSLPAKDRRRRAEDLLERVNAGGFGDRMPGELSGGERQRVAVARGLANRPRILLADEPTGELDSANSRAVIDLITELHRSEHLTVLLVTHDESIAAACPRRFVMRDGSGAFEGKGRS